MPRKLDAPGVTSLSCSKPHGTVRLLEQSLPGGLDGERHDEYANTEHNGGDCHWRTERTHPPHEATREEVHARTNEPTNLVAAGPTTPAFFASIVMASGSWTAPAHSPMMTTARSDAFTIVRFRHLAPKIALRGCALYLSLVRLSPIVFLRVTQGQHGNDDGDFAQRCTRSTSTRMTARGTAPGCRSPSYGLVRIITASLMP